MSGLTDKDEQESGRARRIVHWAALIAVIATVVVAWYLYSALLSR